MWATYRTWECKEIGSANTLGLVCKSHLGILTPIIMGKLLLTGTGVQEIKVAMKINSTVTLSPGNFWKLVLSFHLLGSRD